MRLTPNSFYHHHPENWHGSGRGAKGTSTMTDCQKQSSYQPEGEVRIWLPKAWRQHLSPPWKHIKSQGLTDLWCRLILESAGSTQTHFWLLSQWCLHPASFLFSTWIKFVLFSSWLVFHIFPGQVKDLEDAWCDIWASQGPGGCLMWHVKHAGLSWAGPAPGAEVSSNSMTSRSLVLEVERREKSTNNIIYTFTQL